MKNKRICLQVLPDDPGNNTYGHTPLHIQTGDSKRYIVLFAGHPVVIAGMGCRIDAIGEAHIDNALVTSVTRPAYLPWIRHFCRLSLSVFSEILLMSALMPKSSRLLRRMASLQLTATLRVLESIPRTMKSMSAPSMLPRILFWRSIRSAYS